MNKRAMWMLAAVCIGMFCGAQGRADNITVSNTKLSAPVKGGYRTVSFDVQWEHSWRLDLAGPSQAEPYNYDAAWVFAKYRAGTGEWKHATLSVNVADHTVPAGCAMSVGQTDRKGIGVFLYRNANGAGTFKADNVGLRWQYPSNGIGDSAAVTVKVFAIEMVYVPQGAFKVGDGLTDASQFYAGGTHPPYAPFLIASENAIAIGDAAGQLYRAGPVPVADVRTNPVTKRVYEREDGSGPIPAAFPKGYAAFYGMKYEITQGQYVDFLNDIKPLRTQAAISCCNFVHREIKDPRDIISTRYTIAWNGTDFTVTTPDVACHWLSWSDLAAYLDWAGLRPMTELEYEKACRGPLAPWPGEYAWGNTTIVMTSGQANEMPIPPTANCVGSGGPMRVGCTGQGTGSRIHMGAGYYGMMDLSGNVVEHPVSVGNPPGRGFTGQHGDGALDNKGAANVPEWPGEDASGSGIRGGRVSDRRSATLDGSGEDGCGHYAWGGRGVRTAP